MMKKIFALLIMGAFATYAYHSGYFQKITAKASQSPQTSPDKIDILFIGNSYTYVNDMPTMLSGMARVLGTKHHINTHQITAGGATLETHWNNQTALNTIKSGEWDYIVFQGQSTSML